MLEKAKAAVKELAAARPYIKTLEAEIAEREKLEAVQAENVRLATELAAAQKERAEAEQKRAEALTVALDSQKAATASETQRAAVLEKEVKRSGGKRPWYKRAGDVAIGVGLGVALIVVKGLVDQ